MWASHDSQWISVACSPSPLVSLWSQAAASAWRPWLGRWPVTACESQPCVLRVHQACATAPPPSLRKRFAKTFGPLAVVAVLMSADPKVIPKMDYLYFSVSAQIQGVRVKMVHRMVCGVEHRRQSSWVPAAVRSKSSVVSVVSALSYRISY